jgi:hypothetical protein
MSMSNASENNLLLLIFNNTNWANVGDATGLRGATSAGSFYVSLHTADPGEAGNASSSETAYTNYARQAVARSAGGWTVSGTAPTQAANTAAINFPQCGASGATLTYFGICGGTAATGANEALFTGILDNSLAVSNGVTHSFAIGTCKATMD